MMIQSEQIEIDKIIIGDRARHDFGDIDELANSISAIGLLQPILVTMATGDPLLVDGYRRILAYKKIGRETIPAVIFDKDGAKNSILPKYLQAEHDANVIRKDFTPSEKVWLADRIESWIRTKEKLEAQKNMSAEIPPNETAGLEEKSLSNGKKTRQKVADALGTSTRTLAKAKAVVKSAEQNPENADLVQQMDETGKVGGAYDELKDREKGISKKPEAIPGTATSLIVKMPDGRQKKMSSISNEWWQNKNVLYWIIENVGLGVDEKDILIHRQGNIVKVYDSTNVEGLRQGVSYLVKKYSENS